MANETSLRLMKHPTMPDNRLGKKKTMECLAPEPIDVSIHFGNPTEPGNTIPLDTNLLSKPTPRLNALLLTCPLKSFSRQPRT